MGWLLEKLVGNPALVLWGALAAFAAGGVATGTVVWKYKDAQVQVVQAKFDGFVATERVLGIAAAKAALATEKNDQRRKEQTDVENKRTLTALHADIKRLRDARAGTNFVPQGSGAAGSSESACFNRGELESAIRVFDSEVSGLVDEGSDTVVNLNSAKTWAQRGDKHGSD